MQMKEYFAAIEDALVKAKAAAEIEAASPAVQAVEAEVKQVVSAVETEMAKVTPSVTDAYQALKSDAAGLVVALQAWLNDFEKRHVGK